MVYWEYIVTSTKFLTVYHTLIYSLHYSPVSLLPPFLEQFWTQGLTLASQGPYHLGHLTQLFIFILYLR
jgi:hypothetical protein